MNDPLPRVSVVMAVYNGGAVLDNAVRSILEQTFVDFEFIIVNDGSRDGTQHYLNRLAREDERIRIIHQQNQGLTKALITGCSKARGQYIARQDADDVSLPLRLERQVDALDRSPEAPLVTCWAASVATDGQVMWTLDARMHTVPLDDGTCVRLVGVPAHSSVAFRRDAYIEVGGYRSCFYYAQDCDLWLRLAAVGSFQVVEELLLHHTTTDLNSIGSRCRSYQTRFAELAKSCFRARLADRSEQSYLEQAKQLMTEARTNRKSKLSARNAATSLMLMGARLTPNDPRARHYYWQALRMCPYHLRTWKALVRHIWNTHFCKADYTDIG